MVEFDAAFIQGIEHRPKEIIIAEGIPLIDLSPVSSLDSVLDSQGLEELVEEIGDACNKWGFFQVINHGASYDLRQKIENASRKFFAQTIEEKRRVRRDEVNPLGYYDTEHTKNVRDWKEVFDFSVQDPIQMADFGKEVQTWTNRWPEYPPELREACEEYAGEMEKLCFKLLELISLSLGLAANRMNAFFKDQSSFIRLNHYPPCPSPDLALGVGRHKDGGALTVLAQDEVGGLEVKRRTDGEWIRVKPTSNAFIINVGDIIQVWSNDKYESAEHRVVVNSERERFSIPFFFNPAHYIDIKPLDDLINKENPAKFKAYNWGNFFTSRKGSNFKKLDVENIQIQHFKISE